MRILGIDPGLQTTGFGVVDAEGHALHYVASGTISTQHLARGDLPARLKVLFDGIGEIVTRYQPHTTAVEIVFSRHPNRRSAGPARGACLTALVSRDLRWREHALQMTRRWRPRQRPRRK